MYMHLKPQNNPPVENHTRLATAVWEQFLSWYCPHCSAPNKTRETSAQERTVTHTYQCATCSQFARLVL